MIANVQAAGKGWSAIFAQEPGWRSHFDCSEAGIRTGFIVYALAVVFAIALASLRIGPINATASLPAIIQHVAPILALVVATTVLRRVSQAPVDYLGLMVPGLYLIAFIKVIEGLTVLLGIGLFGALATLSAFFMFRLARLSGVETNPAIGFAIGFFVLVAGPLIALYVLAAAQ